MDLKEQFELDWQTVFPGAPAPDFSCFSSKSAIDNEIQNCTNRLEELRFSIVKEEYLLKKLSEISNKKFSEEFSNSEIVPNTSTQVYDDNLPITKAENLNHEDTSKSLNMERVEENSEMQSENDNSSHNDMMYEQTCHTQHMIINDKKGNESEQSNLENISVDHSFSTFKPSNGHTNRKSISSQTSLNEMFDNEPKEVPKNIRSDKRRFSDLKTYQNAYLLEDQQFDFACEPLIRRFTDPYPTLPTNEPVPKPRPAPRSLPRMKKKPLPPLPKRPSVKNNDQTNNNEQKDLPAKENLDSDDVFENAKEITQTEEKSEYVENDILPDFKESYFQDDEHIYEDIGELSIVRENIIECSSSDSENEQIYENANMLPRLEPLVDNSCTDDVKVTKRLKRLGSEDRQAIVISDSIDVTAGNESERYRSEEIEAILSGSRESLDDDIKDTNNPPNITIDNENDDNYHINSGDYDDDDEHIYANVDDLRIFKESDDGSGSDPDTLAESISVGLPSPLYKEMTPDQIQSMLQKIQSNTSDQSQDESDDDLNTNITRSKIIKKRLTNTTSIEPTVTSAQNNGTAVGETISTPISDSHAVKQVNADKKKSPEETAEEKQHLKASRMRKLLVHNLLDSEKCYLDCLEMLFKFMKPLQKSTESSQPILSKTDYETIFHKTEDLLNLHRDFYEQLEPRVENWNDGQLIGDLFTMVMHSFDVYLGYIGNYKVAMETILKCRHANQYFASIMDQDIRIVSLKDPLKLEGLLYKPVDRMTQYSLILNDLLKYTSPDHPDHPLIVEVSGALFDLFEQVNVDSNMKKKRRQRQLLKETAVVEIDDGERRSRSLILFNDVIICAKLKQSGDAYVCKWYASLCDINIKPYENTEASPVVPVSSKTECDKIRANIANMRQELRREHWPLQQVYSGDSSPPFSKRRGPGGVRSSSRFVEKLKKRITEQEQLLQLIFPSIPLNIYHKNGKVFTLLVNVEAERQAWIEALKPRLKRIHARSPPSIQLSSLELQQAFETVLKVQRLGQRFGSQMPSPFHGSTRPLSVDFSVMNDDKESLTGFLFVSLHYGKGFSKNSDTYVILEMDSYGHFFKKAKTKPCRGSDPQWEENFEFEIEACSTLRLTCFNKLRLMGNDISGKCSINLTRENLVDNRNHTLSVSLDRGQSILNISLCFSTSIDGIKKCPSFSEHGVFGVPISVVCKREKFDIPVIVLSCIKEIEKRGMDEVGIYRLSGVASEIQQLKKLFNEHTQNALLVLADTDIHAVAGLLKLYFRELPQSLFTSKLYQKFVDGLSITDSEEKELYMLDILHQLPKANRMTALYLFEHLRRITLLENENKMGVNNLATVFGPTVLRPPSSTSDKENESKSCYVGTFDIGALDVMSQVGIFRYFLGLKNNERTKLPPDDLGLWRRLDPVRAKKIEEKLMITSDEHLI